MIDQTYSVGKVIGYGGSSKVYHVSDFNNQEYAVKVVRQDKGYTQEFSEKIILREFSIINKLKDHPNITKCFASVSDGYVRTEKDSLAIIYNVLEYCPNGSLAHLIKSTGKLTENVTRFTFRQIAHAIHYMHSQGIAHLDIKHENILLDEVFNIKISDFGSAMSCHKSEGLVRGTRGTASYMAPEVIESQSAYNGFKADVYSLGVTLFVMLTGYFPHEMMHQEESTSDTNLINLSSSNLQSKNKEYLILNELSPLCSDLLEGMLQPDPSKRFSMDDVLAHPWY